MRVTQFMNGAVGRAARVVIGLALVVVGALVGGVGGWVLAIVGLVPLLAGALGVCLIAPLLHAPFRSGPAAH